MLNPNKSGCDQPVLAHSHLQACENKPESNITKRIKKQDVIPKNVDKSRPMYGNDHSIIHCS